MTESVIPPPTHHGGELHYPGDCVADLLGRVMGPTTYGKLLTVYHATHDPATDTTTAHLRPTTREEYDQAVMAGVIQ